MKECWINVYEREGAVWLGICYAFDWMANIRAGKYRIYRIHVRLK